MLKTFFSLLLGIGMLLNFSNISLAVDQDQQKQQIQTKQKQEPQKPDSPQKDESAPESTQDEAQGLWDLLFKNRIAELTTIDDGLAELTNSLPKASRKLETDMNGIRAEYSHLATLASVSRGLPTELTLVSDWLRRLEDRIVAAGDPLEGTLNALKSRLDELASLDTDEAADVAGSGVSEQYQKFMKNLAQTKSKLATLQNRLKRILAPSRNLLGKIQKQREQLVASIPQLWQSYYLDRSGKLYELDTWGKIGQGLAVLKETFTMKMGAELPSNMDSWVSIVLRAIVFSLPALLFLLGSRRFAKHWPDALKQGWQRISSHSLPILCGGLLFHFVAWTPTGGTYHIFSVIGTLLMSIGQMALAWDLYSFDKLDNQRTSPLWPLFAPLLAGLVLLFFNLPPALLGGLWILVLGISLWKGHHRSLNGIDSSLVRNLLYGQTFILCLAVLMTILGWGRLSILMCMFYAALAVSIQQAVGFMLLTNVISGQLPQDGFKGMVGGLALALFLPAILVVAVLATGLWMLAYPGGPYLLSHIAKLDFSVGQTTFNIVQVLFILSAFYLTRSFISVGRSFISKLPQQGGLRQDLIGPVQVAFTYVLWGLFGLYALNALGFSLSNLAMIAGGLSVGIGFGMQNIINNFISGLLIIFGRTIREGDVLELGANLMGTVKRINIRSTMMETAENAIIFVPNAEFLSGRLTNWTRNGRMVRRSIGVDAAYGSDVQKVTRLLQKIATNHPKVLGYPLPSVAFLDFASSALHFELRFWIEDIGQGVDIASELRETIAHVFDEEGIEIPFNQLDVHMRDNEEEPQLEKEAFVSEKPKESVMLA